jgi:hypothetical protein
MKVELPVMTKPQEQAWLGLIAITEVLESGWCLVGGQMVHLLCAERGVTPNRPTDDGDAVLDVRARPAILNEFTSVLRALGFVSAGESMEGHQHRWLNDEAKIDVLIPRNVGERAARRRGASGGTTLEAPGAQQALDRAELIEVSVQGHDGRIPRPNMAGALVIKAAAYANTRDSYRERHLTDFAILTTLINRSDRLGEAFTRRDKAYLRPVLAQCARQPELLAQIEGVDRGLDVLARIVADGSNERIEDPPGG